MNSYLQTPHREFSVECDWQPQINLARNWSQNDYGSHFHFLLDFRCLHNSQQKNHLSPSSGSWHGVSTKKIHSVPVFQAPRHGVIALSLCRLQWPVRRWGRARDPQLARGHSATNSGVLDVWVRVRRNYSCFGLIEHASRDTGQFLSPPIFDCTGAKAHPTHDMKRKKVS